MAAMEYPSVCGGSKTPPVWTSDPRSHDDAAAVTVSSSDAGAVPLSPAAAGIASAAAGVASGSSSLFSGRNAGAIPAHVEAAVRGHHEAALSRRSSWLPFFNFRGSSFLPSCRVSSSLSSVSRAAVSSLSYLAAPAVSTSADSPASRLLASSSCSTSAASLNSIQSFNEDELTCSFFDSPFSATDSRYFAFDGSPQHAVFLNSQGLQLHAYLWFPSDAARQDATRSPVNASLITSGELRSPNFLSACETATAAASSTAPCTPQQHAEQQQQQQQQQEGAEQQLSGTQQQQEGAEQQLEGTQQQQQKGVEQQNVVEREFETDPEWERARDAAACKGIIVVLHGYCGHGRLAYLKKTLPRDYVRQHPSWGSYVGTVAPFPSSSSTFPVFSLVRPTEDKSSTSSTPTAHTTTRAAAAAALAEALAPCDSPFAQQHHSACCLSHYPVAATGPEEALVAAAAAHDKEEENETAEQLAATVAWKESGATPTAAAVAVTGDADDRGGGKGGVIKEQWQKHTHQTEDKTAAAAPTDVVYSGSWIEAFNKAGYIVAALDMQGHGLSEGWERKRATVRRFDDFAIDVVQFLHIIRQHCRRLRAKYQQLTRQQQKQQEQCRKEQESQRREDAEGEHQRSPQIEKAEGLVKEMCAAAPLEDECSAAGAQHEQETDAAAAAAGGGDAAAAGDAEGAAAAAEPEEREAAGEGEKRDEEFETQEEEGEREGKRLENTEDPSLFLMGVSLGGAVALRTVQLLCKAATAAAAAHRIEAAGTASRKEREGKREDLRGEEESLEGVAAANFRVSNLASAEDEREGGGGGSPEHARRAQKKKETAPRHDGGVDNKEETDSTDSIALSGCILLSPMLDLEGVKPGGQRYHHLLVRPALRLLKKWVPHLVVTGTHAYVKYPFQQQMMMQDPYTYKGGVRVTMACEMFEATEQLLSPEELAAMQQQYACCPPLLLVQNMFDTTCGFRGCVKLLQQLSLLQGNKLLLLNAFVGHQHTNTLQQSSNSRPDSSSNTPNSSRNIPDSSSNRVDSSSNNRPDSSTNRPDSSTNRPDSSSRVNSSHRVESSSSGDRVGVDAEFVAEDDEVGCHTCVCSGCRSRPPAALMRESACMCTTSSDEVVCEGGAPALVRTSRCEVSAGKAAAAAAKVAVLKIEEPDKDSRSGDAISLGLSETCGTTSWKAGTSPLSDTATASRAAFALAEVANSSSMNSSNSSKTTTDDSSVSNITVTPCSDTAAAEKKKTCACRSRGTPISSADIDVKPTDGGFTEETTYKMFLNSVPRTFNLDYATLKALQVYADPELHDLDVFHNLPSDPENEKVLQRVLLWLRQRSSPPSSSSSGHDSSFDGSHAAAADVQSM